MAFTILNEADAFDSNQAEPDSVDIDILVAGFSASGVISGCEVTAQGTPDRTVAVASGTVIVAGTVVSVTGANVDLGVADITNPAFALISVNNSGTLAGTGGTAASEPVFPAIPANSIVLAAVFSPAADAAIESNQITDKRVFIDLRFVVNDLRVDGDFTVTGNLIYTAGAFAFQEATVISTTTGNITINPAGNILMSGKIINDIGFLRGQASANLFVQANKTANDANARRLIFSTIDTTGNVFVDVAYLVPTGTETAPFFAMRALDITTPLTSTLDENFIAFRYSGGTLTAFVNDGGSIKSGTVGTLT